MPNKLSGEVVKWKSVFALNRFTCAGIQLRVHLLDREGKAGKFVGAPGFFRRNHFGGTGVQPNEYNYILRPHLVGAVRFFALGECTFRAELTTGPV
jgi:hypothetical protein